MVVSIAHTSQHRLWRKLTNKRYGCQVRELYWSDLSWKILQASFAVQSYDLGPSIWFIRSCYFTRTSNYHKVLIIAKITLRFVIWPFQQVKINIYRMLHNENSIPWWEWVFISIFAIVILQSVITSDQKYLENKI